MVEVLIERDDEGRVQVVTLYGDDSPEGLAATMLVEAPILGMKQYLHLDPEVSREGAVLRVRVDRSDLFLDREIDAIMETMVLGLRALAQDRPGKVAVREVGLDVLV
ncbi:hypothetical protein H5T57_04155 [Candidatus Bipolaricaulota bacterium]|nr:hypothetical protein [Candidatus Bipolaricaulota bacterium]